MLLKTTHHCVKAKAQYVQRHSTYNARQHIKGGGPYTPICDFLADSGLLHDRVRLDESFSMGSCSTSGDQNSLRYDLGPHHCNCHVSTQ
jgi:hypothetical protein